jgi:hypothetical protein
LTQYNHIGGKKVNMAMASLTVEAIIFTGSASNLTKKWRCPIRRAEKDMSDVRWNKWDVGQWGLFLGEDLDLDSFFFLECGPQGLSHYVKCRVGLGVVQMLHCASGSVSLVVHFSCFMLERSC